MLSPTRPHSGALKPLQLVAADILRSGNDVRLVEAAFPAAFEGYRAAATAGVEADIAKAAEKRQAELVKLAGSFDAVHFTDMAATLAQVRGLAPLWHQVAGGEKSGAELTKQSYKALFRGDAVLPLTSESAEPFFAFVRDVLVASEAGTLTADQPLVAAEPAAARALGAYLNATTGSLNTHEGKSAHSAAQLQAVCASPAAPSRFLNSSAFPVSISARAGGGPLRSASWLENLYCLRVSLADQTFMVFDVLCSQAVRDHLAAHGVSALSDMPLAAPANGGFSAYLVGQTRVKTAAGAVALNLLPSNAMLEVTASLGKRIAEKTAMRIAALYREQVLAAVPDAVRDVLATEFPVEAFVPAAENGYNIDKLVKALNAYLKPHRVRAIDRALLNQVWKAPEPNRMRQGRHLVRVPIVGSNPQNCGGAYLAFAGKQGPYRFPAAPTFQRKTSSRDERSFHMADRLLDNAVNIELGKRAEAQSLEEKYQVGDKWLPRRVQRNMQRGHIEGAARTYAAIVKRVASGVRLTDDERALLDGPGLSPVQAYVLHGAQAEMALVRDLAQRGLGLLKAADAGAHELFVDAVTTFLTESKA